MSAAPFDVRVIQARLQAQVPEFRKVGLAADFAEVEKLRGFTAPAAYVLLAAEKGEPRSPGHAPRGQQVKHRQMVHAFFGVALVARNYRAGDVTNEISDDLKTLLAKTRKAVIGFVPDVDGGRACEFVEGELRDQDASTALWLEVYATQHSIGN